MRSDLFIAIVLLPSIIGCAPRTTTLNADVRIPDRTAVVFFVDGLHAPTMHAMLAEGALPNVAHYFPRNGQRRPETTTVLPSITYAATVSLLTGTHPGRHGITGNRWFDRETLILRDYVSPATYTQVNHDFTAATIHEQLDAALPGGAFTASIQCPTHRGADLIINNPLDTGLDWLFGTYENTDARVADELTRVVAAANARKQWPHLILLYFPGVDEIGHRTGPHSLRYRNALRKADAAIGKTIADLRRLRVDDRTLLLLVTDHGMPPAGQQTESLKRWLAHERGLRIRTKALVGRSYQHRARQLAKFDAVLTSGSQRQKALFIRGRCWKNAPSSSTIADFVVGSARTPALYAHPAIEFIAYRTESPGETRILSHRGAALITRHATIDRAATYSYTVEAGAGDPLLYARNRALRAFITEGPYTADAWHAATIHTPYPDTVVQLAELMQTPRAGDVAIFARRGLLFASHDRGGHGAATDAELQILALLRPPPGFAAPRPPRRITDLTPLLVHWLAASGQHTPPPPAPDRRN